MSAFKLSDVRLDHPVLGCRCIQLQFVKESGERFNFQWPLNHGNTADEVVIELHAFADRLRRDIKAMEEKK